MSVAVLWEIYCDAIGCPESYTVTGGRSESSARLEAKAVGWGRWRNGYQGDYCPEHKGSSGGAS